MDGRTKHFIAKHLQPFACPSVAIHRMQTILTYKRDSIQDTLNTVPSAPLASVRHLFPWYFGYERIPCTSYSLPQRVVTPNTSQAGTRVFFWASNAQIVYGTVQSTSRMPDVCVIQATL